MTTADLEMIGRRVRRSDPGERAQLLGALEALTDRLEASPRAQALVAEILTSLAADGDPDLRRKLARWAAEGRCTSHALAVDLAFDGIEVAAPVISRSPALEAQDLLRLLSERGPEHQIALGRRRTLEPAVIEAVLEQAEPEALTALAANPAAVLAPENLDRLVLMAERLPGLRSVLSRRADLSAEHGRTLAGQSRRPGGWERRLVAKLRASDRLSPGYALRVLREGELALFEHAVAALADRPREDVRAACESDGPEALAGVCAAAGIDPGVLKLVLAKVREHNDGQPGDAVAAPKRKARATRKRSAPKAGGTVRRGRGAPERART